MRPLTAVDSTRSYTSSFDYRAGDTTANNTHGPLKCLLIQICGHFPSVAQDFADRNQREPLNHASVSRLLNILRETLGSLRTRICAFVDGLGEYKGDYVDLVQMLLDLQERASIKLCLASRPETTFQRLLKSPFRLVMQEHNEASFHVYINDAVDRARDELFEIDHVIDASMRKKVIDGARGSLLWGRLAVDALVNAAIHLMQISQLCMTSFPRI